MLFPGELTADELNAVLERLVRKENDESIQNNTYQDDDELFMSVLAGGLYRAHLHIIFNSGTTPDFKISGTVPSGATAPKWTWHSASATAGGPAQVADLTTGVLLDGTGADAAVDGFGLIDMGGSDGLVQIRWAQITTTASNTTVKANSFLSLTKVG
jgi:hypothetical protein